MSKHYLRVSTFEQESGLASQDKALKDYLAGHGITDVKWYRDRVSGSTTDRPALERLQKDIFSGKIKTVVCWKLDRLSRSLKDGINILTDWIEKDVRIVSVAQQLDFSGAAGQMIASVLFAVAAMERENIRENTKRGLAAAKARGVKLGKRARITADKVNELQAKGLNMTAPLCQNG
ncbi:MAG: recombinase family protein [Phycisphaerae bacterium]|nr:recombinase family protein [Phycisphaerae bacterium]